MCKSTNVLFKQINPFSVCPLFAVDVAPVYPEDESPSVVTPVSVSDKLLTDISVPGDDDEVSHFVEVKTPVKQSEERKEKVLFSRRGTSSATSDFEEIIKKRLQKEIEKKERKLALKELAAKPKSYGSTSDSTESRSARFNSGFSRDRSRSRYSSKSRESLYTKKDDSDNTESSYGFKPSRSSHSVRNRFASLHNSRRETSKATIVKPSLSKSRYASSSSFSTSSSSSSSSSHSNSNVPEIKKFDRFKRPNYKNNFLKKYFPKPKISSYQDQDSEALEIFPSIVENDDTLQNIDNEEEHFERLMTTLQVSSIYPKELSAEYLEVATIRSPYTFNIEDNEKSTRFITITKSITKSMDIAPTKSFTSSASSTLAVSEIKPSSSIPLFDTNSIPPPENILASTATPYEAIIQGSSDIEFLSPVTLTSSLHHATPPLKTVTETLSTVETMIKKSILPVVFGEESSLYTLTQTYSVTRIVTAVKTVPPMDLYEFNPQQNFADFDTLFEEAGSERRESLLPGELEFSDQDNFGLEGPSVIKVAPPSDFVKDLDLIGSKFDFVDQMEKHNNPDVLQLKGSTPSIDSSFGQNSPSFAPEVTPEQLLYLQFLSNPLAALGIGGLGAQVTFL